MPILYTCMLNAKEQLVFEGFYTDQRVSYKTEVLKKKLEFEYMMIKEIHLNEEDGLSLIYQHKGALVLVTVFQNVDSHEIMSFLQAVYKYVQEFSYLKTGGLNSSSHDNELGSSFQEQNAEQLYISMGKDLTTFQTEWNRNPANRSKAAQLFEQLNSAKNAMLDAQRLSLERGEKTSLLLNKSEELMSTSVTYKQTAKQVKKTFCMRKWKMILALVLIVVVLVVLLWLLFFKL